MDALFVRRIITLVCFAFLAGTAFRAGLHTDGAVFLTGALLLFGGVRHE